MNARSTHTVAPRRIDNVAPPRTAVVQAFLLMNATGEDCRVTAAELARRKGGTPIVCLTAYTAPVATILDGHAELLLVGDSLGMVIYGFDSTRAVTLDMMIAHGEAEGAG